MTTRIRKAVIPMAGKGTRFRPMTHVVPKEFLPILNRPLLHYVIAEAVAAGCEELICIIASGRELVTAYLPHTEFAGLRVTFAVQAEARGLGDAIRCAEAAVGEEPCLVLLPDNIFVAPTPVCAQLVAAAASVQTPAVIAVRPEPEDRLASLGVIAPGTADGPLVTVRDLVEKPAPGSAPSNLTIAGRYLLPPTIFGYLRAVTPGSGGEIQLTDALRLLAARESLYALTYEETAHFDAGQPPGWVAANQYFAREAGIL